MKVHVSIYNDKHEELLKSSPKFNDIKKIDGTDVELSEEDFLIYSIFKEQKPYPGFDTYSALRNKVPDRISRFNDYLDLSSTITAKFGNASIQKEITEEVGIGAALSIIGKIHDLTEADWNIINESRTKDLDFYVSSDGDNIIEVECKGTFSDPNKKTSSVSSKRSDIEAKKNSQRKIKNKNLLYGVITSYNDDKSKIAHCRILDPESEKIYDDPKKLRILSRLFFYLNELNSISKSHFLIALANRIQHLMHTNSNEFYEFDKVPLVKANGEQFSFPVSFEFNKTRISELDGFGDVIQTQNNDYLFYGFCDDIVNALIEQDFTKLLKISFKPKTIQTHIITKLSKKEIGRDIYFLETTDGFAEKRLYGKALQTSAGRIFGIFNIDKPKE